MKTKSLVSIIFVGMMSSACVGSLMASDAVATPVSASAADHSKIEKEIGDVVVWGEGKMKEFCGINTTTELNLASFKSHPHNTPASVGKNLGHLKYTIKAFYQGLQLQCVKRASKPETMEKIRTLTTFRFVPDGSDSKSCSATLDQSLLTLNLQVTKKCGKSTFSKILKDML